MLLLLLLVSLGLQRKFPSLEDNLIVVRCGGGVYAATTAIGQEMDGAVEVNPLYQSAGTEVQNPLWG